jgi:lysophospholipase L1-like esterase
MLGFSRFALALVAAALGACGSPARQAASDDLTVYAGRSTPGSHVTVGDFEGQVPLTGDAVTVPKPASPRVPASQVSARLSSKDAPDDALSLSWKGAWYAQLRIEGNGPVDLRPYVANGTLEFDLNVIELAEGGMKVKVSCGNGCERKVPFLRPGRAMAGKGWQHVALSMACFFREGDDFSTVTSPFSLDGTGNGQIAVANVRFVRRGTPNAACPDYKTESVTPDMLPESWTLGWWPQRHQKKLDEIRQLQLAGKSSELVFIGDSITQGWENEGQAVWSQNFKKYNALNLGFGGDHTENVLWRLQHGEIDGFRPKVVVLMIGTNNTGDRQEDPKTTAAGVRRIVDEIRQRQPQAKVLLLAVFPRDEKPGSLSRRINDRVNSIIGDFADGQKVFFLNINASLMNPDGTLPKDVMPDMLHLSEKGYALWARSMEPTLLKLLASKQ